ncbi:hypothetical protein EMCRGX_G022998 [Ephydatia muelleri]
MWLILLYPYNLCCISCGTERTKRRLSCFSHRAVASSTSCEGANNPYTKVNLHLPIQLSSCCISHIPLYQTGKWSLYVVRSLTAALERLH